MSDDIANSYIYPRPVVTGMTAAGRPDGILGTTGVLRKAYLYPMTIERPDIEAPGDAGSDDGSLSSQQGGSGNSVIEVTPGGSSSPAPEGATNVTADYQNGAGTYMLGAYDEAITFTPVGTIMAMAEDGQFYSLGEIGEPDKRNVFEMAFGVTPAAWYRFLIPDSYITLQGGPGTSEFILCPEGGGHYERWTYHRDQGHQAPRTRPTSSTSTGSNGNYAGGFSPGRAGWTGGNPSAGWRGVRPTRRTVHYARGKKFQFNPASLSIGIEMSATADGDTEAPGGNYAGNSVGFASTGIKMLFDRSQEVYGATMGLSGIDPIFKDIGVQKDIFDVMRIIFGDELFDRVTNDGIGNVEQLSPSGVRRGSVTTMTEKLFDLGVGGMKAYAQPVALVFNANLAINALVTGLNFNFVQFNNDLVPTIAAVDLSLSILNTTSVSGLNSLTGNTQIDPTAVGGQSLSTSAPSASGTNGTQRRVPAASTSRQRITPSIV